MSKIRIILWTVFIFLFLAGSVSAQKTKAPARDYFPLRVGDSWTYRHDEADSQFTVKVVSEEKQADGTTRFLVVKDVGVEIQSWYTKAGGWVLMHREAYANQEGLDVKHEPARQYLKNPLIARAKWTWRGKSLTGLDAIDINEVIGAEVVKTLAGTFRAMKLVSKYTDGEAAKTNTYWYADGVGLVKMTTESGTVKYGWELADYSFKKKSPNARRQSTD